MLIIPAISENLTTRKDKTWKLTFGTNELSAEQAAELVKLNQEFCYLAIKKDEFKPRDLEILAGIQSEFEFKEKPPGQRLQAVFYRLWEIDKQGYVDFHLYYRFQMEKLIEHFKTKLP
jgi:hypothetical protein